MDLVNDFARISGTTKLVTLIGKPTEHSLSPAIHNASFAQVGVDAAYLCLDVESADDLPAVLGALRVLPGWVGCNVTMPYKQDVIPLLDELDDAARLIGAVNVICARDGRLIGHNTDGAGFWDAVRRAGVEPRGARVALFGCGGAGAAILAQAALDGCAAVDVVVRPGGSGWRNASGLAERLADAGCACQVGLVDADDEDAFRAAVDAADIVVNASPVGMGEGCDDTPVPAAWLRPELTVADAVYFPRQTRLLRDAREAGARTVGGLGMLLGQAALGEKLWFALDMDLRAVESAVFSADVP